MAPSRAGVRWMRQHSDAASSSRRNVNSATQRQKHDRASPIDVKAAFVSCKLRAATSVG